MIIDQLSLTSSDNLTDEVPVEQGQLTFKTTWQKVLNLFKNALVQKSGDTMTGALTVKDNIGLQTSSFTDGTQVSTTANGKYLDLLDSNSYRIGYLTPRFYSDGAQGIRLGARRNINGSDQYAAIDLGINSDGTRFVSLSANVPNAFMDALSESTAYTTSTISDIATAGTDVTISAASYAQWGKIASVYFQLSSSSALSSSSTVTLATLKTGKRPAIISIANGGTLSEYGYYCSINTSGQVRFRGAVTAGTSIYIQSTFILP